MMTKIWMVEPELELLEITFVKGETSQIEKLVKWNYR